MISFDLGAVEERLERTRFRGLVKHFASVGSTNKLAMEAAQAGIRGGVWVADEQTAGRGRGGHGWHSVVGNGLYMSALVSPRKALPMDRAMWISMATGMAAQAAIEEVSGLRPDLRWPNDVLVRGRKCGGILVESVVVAGESLPKLRYAVVGVGINVNHDAFPEQLRETATSMRIETGREMARERLLATLLRELDREIGALETEVGGSDTAVWSEAEGGTDAAGGSVTGGPVTAEDSVTADRPVGRGGLLERFAASSSWVQGKRVRVEEGGGYTGVTAGLDARGFLRVDGDDGLSHTVLSGGVRELV